MKSFYITTAIFYLNAPPHIGHAYEAIYTDAIARFKRLDGYNVMFLTGTDEHGEKVANAAEKSGLSPQEFTDNLYNDFIALTEELNITNDDFIRTTQERHKRAAHALWQKMADNGDIYLGNYAGWYSVRDEVFFGEDEIHKGEDGNMYAPGGGVVTWKEEPSYFFRLSAYTEKLLKLYDENPDFIQPQSRCNEIRAFLKDGLHDLSVSRTSLQWGISVPGDSAHVMYVWVDALTNYLTAIGYPDTDSDKFRSFWPAECHIIGKDIIRFHTVFWPAFLMSAGLDLPKSVFAHGFINIEGRKMSKSVGNVISHRELINRLGADQTRYIMLREVSHGQDGNFSYGHAIERLNADLANGLGNLAQRTLSLIHKNCNQSIPAPSEINGADEALLEAAYGPLIPECRNFMDSYEVHNALKEISALSSAADSYIDSNAPWKLKNDRPERMRTVLYVLAEVIRCLGIAMQPFTPEGAGALLDQLEIPQDERKFEHIDRKFALKEGQAIKKPEGIFPRLSKDDPEIGS